MKSIIYLCVLAVTFGTALHASAQPGTREYKGVKDTLLFENFDNGAPGWEFKDAWDEIHWHVSTTGAYSGHSYWCGDEQFGGYDDHWQQTLTTPPVNLADANEPVLTFRHYFKVEPSETVYWGFDGWDAMMVRISTDGENFNPIFPADGREYDAENAYGFFIRFGINKPGWTGSSPGWISSGFNLQAYAGHTVWIQFLFGADEGSCTQQFPDLFGWRIDDIRVKDGAATIFDDDAGDTGEAKMVAGNAAGYSLWHITEEVAASQPASAGCFDAGSGSYKAGMNATLVSPSFPVANLPDNTRELEIDFQLRGNFDQTWYLNFWTDELFIEVMPFQNGKWDYWTLVYYTGVVPEEFLKFKDFYHTDLDISDFVDADSLRIRIHMISCLKDEVKTPANFFIDDFLVVAKTGYEGQQFGSFYDRIITAPMSQRPAIADSFMATLPVCPLVENNSVVTFLYQGDVTSINIPGLNINWYELNCPMEKIPGTDLWFCQTMMLPDARQEYKFFINESTWISDPLNPDIVPYDFNNSQIEMSGYVPPVEVEYVEGIPHGTYKDTVLTSAYLGNSRTIRTYLPPNYDSDRPIPYPVILFHDGLGYYIDGKANNVLDYLIHENRIEPLIAVFVNAIDRENEYAGDLTDEFESFIIEEVMPMIDAKYRTWHYPQYRAMSGSSYGGHITAQICYNHPDEFGLCAPMSPSFYPKEMEVFSNFMNGPKKDLKFYIDWGLYEFAFLYYSYVFKNNLIYKGYEVEWHEWHENHSLGNWRGHFDNMLEYFFPKGTSVNEEDIPNPFDLKVFPNPCHSTIEISYYLMEDAGVNLMIYDIDGKEIVRLASGDEQRGMHRVSWDGSMMTPGCYLCILKSGNQSVAKRIIRIE